MHALIERYRVDPVGADTAVERIERAAADAVAAQVGFVEYDVIAAGPASIMTVMLFDTREEAERAGRMVEEFASIAADAGLGIEPEWTVAGEVLVRRDGGPA